MLLEDFKRFLALGGDSQGLGKDFFAAMLWSPDVSDVSECHMAGAVSVGLGPLFRSMSLIFLATPFH